MPSRAYTLADKIHALKLYELCEGNLSAVARETGFPRKTIAGWVANREAIMASDRHMASQLTDKQEKFVEAWIDSHNATEAAREAGYGGDENALAAAGSRLLRNVKILDRIQQRTLSAANLTKEEILGTLADHMRGDVTDCLNDAGYFSLDLARSHGVTHLIKKIKYGELGVSEIEFHNQQTATVQLAKIYGLHQEPRTNQHDKERILKLVDDLAVRYNKPREEVVADVIKRMPQAEQWLM